MSKFFNDITIERMCNGAVVKVGCTKFVFEKKSFSTMMFWIQEYLLNPEGTMKEAREKLEYGDVYTLSQPRLPEPPRTEESRGEHRDFNVIERRVEPIAAERSHGEPAGMAQGRR